MKTITIICLACLSALISCWKPPLIGQLEGYKPPLIPELVKTRAIYFANRYGVSNVCLIQKEQVVYEPFIYVNNMPDSISWRKNKMNKDMNVFCDSVLRDHRYLLPEIEVRFDVFFYSPSGIDLGRISFDYKDLTQYPFPF